MTKVSVILLIVGIGVCVLINKRSEKILNNEYEKGKKYGYEDGYSEIERMYKARLNEQKLSYTKKVNEQKNFYEKKIQQSREEGFEKGQKQKQLEVEAKLQDTISDKERAGDWNDVLFNVN